MATTTFNPVHIETQTRSGPSLFRRIFGHMVKAREIEAKRQMARIFSGYDDAALENMGLTRNDIARWHVGEID